MRTRTLWCGMIALALALVCGAAQGTTQTPVDVTKPVRLSGNVMQASLVHKIDPKYPSKAKAGHIQGTIVLHAIVAKDGKIKDLKYVSGPPELTDSALDAVKKWRYRPTLINGQHVEVDTTVSVMYTLN